ncbi:hypothetical protein P3L51_17310 [Streptomyces sp. PSRA5]|uniref:hypothetical protein n=1 Tax=Streptomyces panacea TaxID=3035064 RepID=UPI00339CFCAE
MARTWPALSDAVRWRLPDVTPAPASTPWGRAPNEQPRTTHYRDMVPDDDTDLRAHIVRLARRMVSSSSEPSTPG